jgi:hypothetical protein
MLKTAAALLLAGLMAAGSAHAQVSAGRGGVMVSPPRDACAAEIHTYCANTPRVAGAKRQCLALHHDHLSSTCRLSLNQIGAGNRHP